MIPPYGLGLRVSYTDGYLRADSKIYDRILSSWDERWWINGNGKGTEYQTRGGGVSGSYFESDGRIKQRINATSRLVRTKKTYSDFIIGLAKKTSIPLFDDAMAAFRKNTDGLSAHPDWTAKEQDFFSTLCRRPQRNAYGFLEKFSTLL
jgi:hypothetical protein